MAGDAVAADRQENDRTACVCGPLRRQGFGLVAGLPLDEGNTALIAFARSLGDLVRESGSQAHPTEGEYVYRVVARGGGLRSRHGWTVRSTTSSEFPLHTDGYEIERPYRAVLLHCVQASSVGGDTLIANVDDVVANLTAGALSALMEPRFPTSTSSVAVLARDEGGTWRVRYNLDAIDHFMCSRESQDNLGQREARVALEELARVAARLGHERAIRLRTGDCVVLDNERVLHGRTAYPSNEPRLLKRVRLSTLRLAPSCAWCATGSEAAGASGADGPSGHPAVTPPATPASPRPPPPRSASPAS